MNMYKTRKTHSVTITTDRIEVDGSRLEVSASGVGMLKEIYRSRIGGYPKFHKMDILCQLGFIASELLLEAEGKERFVESEDRAVILFGKHASIYSDRQYQKTISDKENFYPSPSVFIYTLPNIVTGEIALRNKYHGETSYFALEDKTEMERHITIILETTPSINSVICGWIDAFDPQDFEAEIYIIEKTDKT